MMLVKSVTPQYPASEYVDGLRPLWLLIRLKCPLSQPQQNFGATYCLEQCDLFAYHRSENTVQIGCHGLERSWITKSHWEAIKHAPQPFAMP